MALNFGASIDLRGNQILNQRFENRATPPTNPTVGMVYYNTLTKEPYYYDGSQWRQYGENVALSWKNSAKLYSDSNIVGSYNTNLNRLTVGTSGAFSIDSVSVSLGDRVVLAGQTTAAQNGLYECTTEGASGVAAVLTRSADADEASDLLGMAVKVREGSVYADSVFIQTSDNITLNTTAILFDSFTLNLQYATASDADARASTTKVLTPSALTSYAKTKSLNFVGNGVSNSFSIVHGLGQFVICQVINLSTYQQEIIEMDSYSTAGGGSLSIRFGVAPAAGTNFKVLITEIR